LIVNNHTNISYVGGENGIRAEPTAEERAVDADKHTPPTAEQSRHIEAAAANPAFAASRNNGHPAIAATSRAAEFAGAGVVHPATPGTEAHPADHAAIERPGAATAEHPGTTTAEHPGAATAERPAEHAAERPAEHAAGPGAVAPPAEHAAVAHPAEHAAPHPAVAHAVERPGENTSVHPAVARPAERPAEHAVVHPAAEHAAAPAHEEKPEERK
jgi:hypothetical protein